MGCVVKQSLDELHRVRSVIQTAREHIRYARICYLVTYVLIFLRRRSITSSANQANAVVQTYRGSLDRPDRPETPCYQPPWPLHMTPEAHRLLDKKGLQTGPEDPNGYPADHPDLVWERGVQFRHVPNVRRPPLEMRQWSMLYNLPVGLHMHWPIISSAPYGSQHSEIGTKRREYLFRTFYTDYPSVEGPLPESPTRSSGTVEQDSELGSHQTPIHGHDEPPCTNQARAPRAGHPLVSTACNTHDLPNTTPAYSVYPSKNVDALSAGGPTPSFSQSLKRSRVDEDDEDAQPAKRVALCDETEVPTTNYPRTQGSYGVSSIETPRTDDPDYTLARPPPLTIESHLATRSRHTHHGTLLAPLSPPNFNGADEDPGLLPQARKREREPESEVEDKSDHKPLDKRRRVVEPSPLVRPSLRVREKADTVA